MLIRIILGILNAVRKYWFVVIIGLVLTIPIAREFIIGKYLEYFPIIKIYLFQTGTSFIRRLLPYSLLAIMLSIVFYFYWRYVIVRQLVAEFVSKSSMNWVKHLGNKSLVFIEGEVDSGKTSGVKNGIDILVQYKMDQATKKMNYLKMKMIYLNFRIIDDYILSKYEIERVFLRKDYIVFVETMLSDLGLELYKEHTEKLKFIKEEISIIKLLADYVEHYYVVNLRRVHVIANTPMRNNGEMAIQLVENYTQFKVSSELPIEKYVGVIQDEAGLTDGTRDRSGYTGASRKDYDDGKEQRFAIIRHPDENTGITFILGQSGDEVFGPVLRYMQLFLYARMQCREDILVYDMEVNLLDRLLTYLDEVQYKKYHKYMTKIDNLRDDKTWHSWIPFYPKSPLLKKADKLERKWSNYLERFNNYKKLILKVLPYKEKLEEFLLCKRPLEIHFKHNSVGLDITKENNPYNAFSLNMYYMAKTVYGEYAAHSYKFVRDLRNKNCENSLAAAKRWEDPMNSHEEEIRDMKYKGLNDLLDSVNGSTVIDNKNDNNNPNF